MYLQNVMSDTCIPRSKLSSIPYRLANIPITNFPKNPISMEVKISNIPGSKKNIEHSIPYPWKLKWRISCTHKAPTQASPFIFQGTVRHRAGGNRKRS